MKKLIAISILTALFSSSVFSATPYNAGDAIEGDADGKNFTYRAGTAKFVVNDFGFSLSSQVSLDTAETKSKFAVATASVRGKHAFTGSSEGGSVTTCGDAIDSSFAATDLNALLVLTNQNGCSANSAIGS